MNTEFSYSVGDSVLLAAGAPHRRGCFAPQDTLARLQGDSFAVIVLSETEPDAHRAARRRNSSAALKAAISVGDRDVFLTASVGIAPPIERQARRRSRSASAEAAVYQAKRYGGDYIQFYEPAFGTRSRRIDLDTELRKALEAAASTSSTSRSSASPTTPSPASRR